jgi:drug/metabolite transporter (DMT)-like permease
MALAATVFALMNLCARVASGSMPWPTVAAVRSIVGALVAYGVARMRRASLAPKDVKTLLIRSILGTISMLSTFYALSSRSVSLGDTVTLLNLAPVFMALLAPIVLGERTTAAVGLAIVLALAGVVLVVRPAFLFGSGAPAAHVSATTGPSGSVTVASALLAALSTSLALMMLRRVGQRETPETISFHFAVFAAITTSGLSLLDLRMPTLHDAAWMIAAGVCGGVGQLLMSRAYSLEKAARVAGMSYLSPVVSALLGAALLEERPGPTAIVGMALVIGAGLVVTLLPPSAQQS